MPYISRKKILASNSGGGGTDAALTVRVTTLEDNEYKITYFASISSSTGTITIPTGATILLDQFFGGVDAYVCTIQNGQPTGLFPQTSGGVTVDVSSFDALGNYTLSGTPSSYPVALIYILKIKAKDYSNLTITNILDLEDINIESQLAAKADKSNTVLSTYLEIPEQSKPATPSNAGRIYFDTSNRLSWIGENGYVRTFDGTSNTADRTYTLPNESGTLAVNATYIVPVGYTTALNPADSTTYYIGALLSQSPPTSAGNSRRFAAPITGNATEFRFIFANGTVSSTESNTFVLRNTTQSTSVTITNSYAINGQMIANFTGFTLAVTVGDALQIEWTTPAWATNPVSTQMSGYIVFTK